MTEGPPDGKNTAEALRRRARSYSPWQGTPVQTSPGNVLVVDPDGVSRRFVEFALGPRQDQPACGIVEGVKDAAGAFESLRSTLVELIVSETDLSDMSGVRFHRLLQQESRLRGIPFVFLSADKRVETKVVALRAGVDDYLVKPCDAAELRARVAGLVTRQRRLRDAARERSYTLGGDFSSLPFADLVSILEMSRRTGVVSVITPRTVGELCMEGGRIVHAAFGNLVGPDAFYRMTAESAGRFEFNPGALSPFVQRSVHDTVAALLMEAARLTDEAQVPASAGSLSVRCGTIPAAEKPIEPLVATTALEAQFGAAISDPFALGELRLFNREELSRWTRADVGRQRLHVHLVADLSQGVSAMLPLAGQATERWIRDALSPDEKALGLTFFFRQERVLDITLIDLASPGAFLPSLHRRPSLTILAPPEGNALGIGTKALVELDALLRRVPPVGLLWVARATLDQGVSSVLAMPETLALRGALGDADRDLRSLLTTGLRLWKAQAETEPAAEPSHRRRA
jgi:two-component system chemotaxis response regulator CheY